MQIFTCCCFVIACNLFNLAQATEPSCLEVAKNPAVIKAGLDFMVNSKVCGADGDCSDITEGGPYVCPSTMKVCMPTLMAERLKNPTECVATNLTTGKVEPDCVSGFRRDEANACQFRGPKICTGPSDCPGQVCKKVESQPFPENMRCYTPCDPEAEKIAETNGWNTECGMTRHTPPGEKKTRMQKVVGCDPKGKVCGLKIAREKLIRLVQANKDAFMPQEAQNVQA